ncbi:MAG: hypothetical protein HDR01_15525 [Lachnospiraceae bacterium]|nr:hypothetical protein [Lachnospiraceae bacterium]
MQIIILIIIIALVVSNNKKKTANYKKDSLGQKETTGQYGSRNGSQQANNRAANSRSVTPASVNAQAKKGTKQESVVEYLNKKAAVDQAEHQAEERQAAIRQKKMYGNAKVGRRLLLGDPIPKGMIRVDCGYCGAENVLKSSDRGNCLCYFCRTKL